MNLIFWTIEGLIVGGLAGQWVRSRGRNRVMDLLMGGAGAVGGGFFVIVTAVGRDGSILSNASAILGAVTLILLSRYFDASRESDAAMQHTFRMNRSRDLRVAGLTPAPAVAYAPPVKRTL